MKVEEIKLAFENNQKIELTVLTDLEKLYSKATDYNKNTELKRRELEKLIFNFRDVINSFDATPMITKIGEYEKLSKELGVVPNDKYQKALSDFFEVKKLATTIIR